MGGLIRGLENLERSRKGNGFWYFLRYFLHDAKSNKNVSPSGELRGFANLESAHRSCSFAPQQLKPFQGSSEIFQTSNQRTKTTISHNPIKSFCRPRRHFFLLFDAKSRAKNALSLPENHRGFANLDAAHRSRGELPSDKLEKVFDPRGKFAYIAQNLPAIGVRITVHAFGVKPSFLRNV